VRYRLEQTIVPSHATAAGVLHIDATVRTPTRVVWLNAIDLTVAHAELGGKPARVIATREDFVGLAADAELPAGPLAIDVTYTAGIDKTRARGIYAVQEAGGDSYAYTFFEAIDARRAFPSFDEPAYKVPWTLVFHVQHDHVALANAPVVKETDEPGGMKRVELAESRPLPSYLVAFVVGPFELVDDGTAGRVHTPIRFIIPKGRAGELGYAKEVTPKVLVALESYFDMDYPYGKLDVAVVPRFWGTMEHPGIVAMGQPLTLIQPAEASRERRERYANILAHEMSHYWFGDLVTMKWWDDTWLNEALGSWSDVNITEAAEPSWRFRDRSFESSSKAMMADEKLSTRGIRHAVTSKTDIEASFDGDITYAKGSSVLRMFEAYVGRDVWRGFINGYLQKHAWGNASADDFIADMQATLGPPVADGFRSFLGQPGVPLIAIAPDCKAKTLTLTQRRSLRAGVTDPDPKLWQVPVCFRYGDAKTSTRACKLLDKAEDTVAMTGCPAWIVTNDGGTGYYRSRVDLATVQHVLASRAGAVEKMMALRDLDAAVKRGELAVDKPLSIAPAVIADPDDRVAAMAIQLGFRRDVLDDATLRAYESWELRTFGATAQRLGWQRGKNDSDDRNRLRGQVLELVGRSDAKLGAEAEALADRWIETGGGLDNDLVEPALTVAAYRGDAARFDRYLAAATSARDRATLQRIVPHLGEFRRPELLQRALELVLDGRFDVRDTMPIVVVAIEERETRELAWTWFAAHVDALLAKMRSDEASWLLRDVAAAWCDADHRNAAAALIEPRLDRIDGAANYVHRSLEGDDQCIAYVARELPALKAFLTAYQSPRR
jgi:aminopeptidase N